MTTVDAGGPDVEVLDCRGMRCPLPVIRLAQRLPQVPVGTVVRVLADDESAPAATRSAASVRAVAPRTATRWPLTVVTHGANACCSSAPSPTTGIPAVCAAASASGTLLGP